MRFIVGKCFGNTNHGSLRAGGSARVSRPVGRRELLLKSMVMPALLLAGCLANEDSRRELTLNLGADVQRPARSVFIFFVDGMDRGVMLDLAAAGRLPNITSRFIEGGVGVEYAFSSMPSVTYANYPSVITGLFPGHHGIMGNFWFDRYSLDSHYYLTIKTYRDVNGHINKPTLYDVLGEHYTFNIQGHTRRGVTQSIDSEQMFCWCWIWGMYKWADSYTGSRIGEMARMANRVKRWPTLVMTYYPGVDEIGHRWGPGSPEYAQALINIDGIIGRVTGMLDRAGLSETTYFVLMSDHGMAPVGRPTQIDLLGWLRQARGLRVRTTAMNKNDYDLDNYAPRYELMKAYDAVAYVDAGRVAMVHLRGRRGWAYRPEPQEVLDWLRAAPSVPELPAVRVALCRAGADRVQVLGRDGSALIERRESEAGRQYRLAEYQGDPLGYRRDPSVSALLSGDWRTSRAWLAATARSACPDFVPQAVEMFDSPRTGDVVLFAADGWAFHRGEVGGHGSVSPRDMRILWYIAGAGLPRKASIPYGRLVDITPTIIGLLGEEKRLSNYPPMDGLNLADELRHAR